MLKGVVELLQIDVETDETAMPQLAVDVAGCPSTTLAVKLIDPGAVGDPVIAPVEEFSVSPAGKAPTVEKAYGVAPPDAPIDDEYAWFS